MSILTLVESWLKGKSIPLIYLVGIVYLFSIDIVILLLLGYHPKDILFLIDIQKIVLLNTIIIISFVLLYLMIKKHLIASTMIAFILTAVYARYNNIDLDSHFDIVFTLFVILFVLVFNVYEYFERLVLDTLWKLNVFNIFIGFLFATITVMLINYNMSQWNSLIENNNKVELNRLATPLLVIKPKSFNTLNLQELNQDLQLLVNSTYRDNFSKQTYRQDDISNENVVLIPHDGTLKNNKAITIYYYDMDDIKNIFILDPSTCDKDGVCELQTLITRAINKNDISKGYQLISDYKHLVQIEG